MAFKKNFLIGIVAAFLFSLLAFGPSVFAEGDTVCSGRITGVTPLGNPNGGVVSFNSHQGPGVEDGEAISLSIVGMVSGLAPGKRGDAACVSEESGTFNGQDYEYAVKGWGWNTNGGFISFSCQNGVNNAGGDDVACGGIDYGVYVSPEDDNGDRKLFGYAWSPTFGWIQFDNNAGDLINYGVQLDANGDSSGYAWTQSKIYLDFSSLNFQLPGANVVNKSGKGWCDGKSFLCVEIDPDPMDLKFDTVTGNTVKLADGNDGYDLHLYFKDSNANPVNPDLNSNFVKGIAFNWKDTVKTDQVSAGAVPGGAVTFKPLTIVDFAQVSISGQKDVGHFISKKKITSYAPTSESKLSPTTSTKPVYYVNNEEFFSPPDGVTLPTEKNELILKNITYPDWFDNTGKLLLKGGVIYPNGKVNMPLRFSPAVVVNTLYANDFQDAILAYRSVPMNFKIGIKILGNLLNDASFGDGTVDFNLVYSKTETGLQPDCSGQDFVFRFLKDLQGGDLSGKQQSIISAALKSFNNSGEVDVQAIAELTQSSCAVAKGANLYTRIAYKIGGKAIQYYDNKLPRIGGDAVLNPIVVVHGNIYAQAVGTVREDERVQTSGSVDVNIIRNTIDENIENYSDKAKVANLVKGDCDIDNFKDQIGGFSHTACTAGSYLSFDVGNEHVLYFKGSNVTLDLLNDNWAGKWVIINEDGNLFIKSNIKAVSDEARLSLIAFRAQSDADYFRTGNVYIAPCSKEVTDIKATIVADGSVFSYDGNVADIDPATGEPKWASYSDMVNSLNCQLFINGAIYSDNTIGGANLDQGVNPKNYLLAGGGRVIKLPASLQDRMRAQYYDLNYLRMFRLDLELTAGGLPIDQKCGKGWTAEDQKNLLAGQTVCGERKPCNMDGDIDQANACNGINPLVKYDTEKPDGDLITPPIDDPKLSKGLKKGKDFEPVYVYLAQPDKGSFVFSKQGAVSIGGK